MLLLISSSVSADWLRVSMNTLIMADWAQTRTVASNPNFVEANPLLGKYPTRNQVDAFFITNLVVINYVGENHITNKKLYYGVMSATRLAVVLHNRSIGVTFKF
jgi:hypothetical protein